MEKMTEEYKRFEKLYQSLEDTSIKESYWEDKEQTGKDIMLVSFILSFFISLIIASNNDYFLIVFPLSLLINFGLFYSLGEAFSSIMEVATQQKRRNTENERYLKELYRKPTKEELMVSKKETEQDIEDIMWM